MKPTQRRRFCSGWLLDRVGADEPPPLIRSVASGRWSDPASWEGGRVPGRGPACRCGPATSIIYDIETRPDSLDPRRRHSAVRPRSRHAARRRADQDPGRRRRRRVGFRLRDASGQAGAGGSPGGLGGRHSRTARSRAITRRSIRLALVRGLDPEECPAIVCCGGRMDFHGAEL